MATDVREAILGVIQKIDREMEALQALRNGQMAMLATFDNTVDGGGVDTPSQRGTSSTLTPSESKQSTSATAVAASVPAAQDTGAESSGAQVSTSRTTTPRAGTRTRGAASKGATRQVQGRNSRGQGKAAGPDANQAAKPERKKRGPNKRTLAAQANGAESNADQTPKPERKKRGPNKRTLAAQAQSPGNDASTPSPNGATDQQQPQTSAGAQIASPAANASPAGASSSREVTADMWPTLLTKRGKSALDLARKAAKAMNLDDSKESINRLAESASQALEQLVSSGGVTAHGEGAARVFAQG